MIYIFPFFGFQCICVLNLNYVSCMQYIIVIFIQSNNLYLLIGQCNSFTINIIIDIFGFVLLFYAVCPAFSFLFLLFPPSLSSPFKKLFEMCLFFSIPVFLSLVWKLHTVFLLAVLLRTVLLQSPPTWMAWYLSSVNYFLSHRFSFIYPTSFYLD